MKSVIFKTALAGMMLCLTSLKLYAAYTYTWTGGTSTVWELSSNWSRTGTGGTSTYPGESGSVTDIVQIGVTTTFTRQPVQSGTVTIASMTIGTASTCTLTINGALTVSGNVTQMNNSSAGGITNSLTGSGSLSCTNFNLGDSTLPPAPILGLGNATYLTTLNYSLANLIINQNLVLTTTSKKASLLIVVTLVPSSNVNNPIFNFNSGNIYIGNQLQTADANDTNLPAYLLIFGPVSSSAQFLMNPTTGNTARLNLGGANALSLDGNAGYADFYGISGGISTVTYTGNSANQEIYTSTTPYSATRQSPNGLDQTPATYQNLSCSGAFTKIPDGGNLTVGANLALISGTDSLYLATNNPITTIGGGLSTVSGTKIVQGSGNITVSGGVTNAGVLKLGSGGFTVGGNYNNTGFYIQTTGTTLFNGSAAQTLQDASIQGTVFHTVNFSGAGAKTMSSGNFYVSSTSVLTMVGSSTLAAGGNLTLLSDASGSATIAQITSAPAISGNVNVQRYLTGGAAKYRGYRLLSSPVTQGSGIYSINYLLNSVYLTGTTGIPGGFDKAGNPTLYLFRENLAPLYTTFLNSAFRGINTISTSPNYLIDGDPGTFNIPVGNGYLFFFRGDRSVASLAAETTTTYVPTSATLTTTGTLNQGAIAVKDWYTPGSSNLGYTTTSGNSSVQGFNLVGNPYASSIDWDTFGSTAGSAIYGPGLTKFIYIIDSQSKNYGVYQAGSGTTGTLGTTNIIPSGQGFFVIATCPSCAQLVFNESSKVNTQVTGGNLLMTMRSFNVSTATDPYLRLQMSLDSTNRDETLVMFGDSTHSDFKEGEDAPYRTGQGKVRLASISSDGLDLAINALPLSQHTQTIGLDVDATADGIYKISLNSAGNIPASSSIWLMDAYRQDSLDMRQNITYSFNVYKSDSASFGNKRFKLLIRPHTVDTTASKITTTIAHPIAGIDIYPNPVSNVMHLNVPVKSAEQASYTVTIMDSSGLRVKKATFTDSEWQANVSGLRPGTYLVRVVNTQSGAVAGESKFVKL